MSQVHPLFESLLAAFAPAIKVVECHACKGVGAVIIDGISQRCAICYGRGKLTIETEEPRGRSLNGFEYGERYGENNP